MRKPEELLAILYQVLPADSIQQDVELAPLTWFKIGGKASFYFVAHTNDELVSAVYAAKLAKIKHVILAGASNVLFGDNGYDGLVIHLQTKDLIVRDNSLIVDAGVSLADVVNKSIELGLQGLVWASGIPGTVGGAVRGNAGAYGGSMSDVVESVEILRGKKQFVLAGTSCDFSYRDSLFKHNNDTLITIKIDLKPNGNPADMYKESIKIIEERKIKHPELPCAGSYFKNILTHTLSKDTLAKLNLPQQYLDYGKIPTGWLVEKLDMKGFSIGQAQISPQHGNIIVNNGGATADEVLQLASIIKMKIRDTFGIQIEEEVQYIQ